MVAMLVPPLVAVAPPMPVLVEAVLLEIALLEVALLVAPVVVVALELVFVPEVPVETLLLAEVLEIPALVTAKELFELLVESPVTFP